MLIIGVDPGKMTGVAHYDINTGSCSTYSLLALDACDIIYEHVCDKHHGSLITICCERYTMLPGRRSAQPEALHVVGTLAWMCRRLAVPFALRGASEATKIAPRRVIECFDLWRRGQADHERRAAAQVILHISLNYPTLFASRTAHLVGS